MARIIFIFMILGAVALISVLGLASLGGATDRRGNGRGGEVLPRKDDLTPLRGVAYGLLWLLMTGLATGLIGAP